MYNGVELIEWLGSASDMTNAWLAHEVEWKVLTQAIYFASVANLRLDFVPLTSRCRSRRRRWMMLRT